MELHSKRSIHIERTIQCSIPYSYVRVSSTVRTIPVVVNVERTEIIVGEEEGTVAVCVSAVDVGSAVISVSVTDDPGNTTQGMVRKLMGKWILNVSLYQMKYITVSSSPGP